MARLLDRIEEAPWRDSTALVVVADHGTALGQHDHMGHGLCWDEQLRVPLLIRVPGVAPQVIDALCSTLDLWPTLFGLVPELADARFLEQCRGSDVLAADHVSRPLLATAAKQGIEALTAGHWKLLRSPRSAPQLFDLEADPSECQDVAAAHADVVAGMLKVLESEVAKQKKAAVLHRKSGAPTGTPDPKLLEELRALGYTEDDPSGAGGASGAGKTGGSGG